MYKMRLETQYVCCCGSIITLSDSIRRHLKSSGHSTKLFQLQEDKRLKDNGLYKVKIYKIVNNVDDKIYIGSTIQPLYKRINQHRNRHRRSDLTQYSSKILFDTYGVESCSIILLEECEVHNVEEERMKEREWIDRLKPKCVNLHLPNMSKDDMKKHQQKYFTNNKERIVIDRKNKRDKLSQTPFVCECGSSFHPWDKARHNKCNKHLTYLQTQQIN